MMPHTDSPIRERILDAAFTAFTRAGYDGASTAEIARLAHVSKRDLYACFPTKHAMLEACVTDRAERMRAPLALPEPTTIHALRETLAAFGSAVIHELSQPSVLAAYRLAIVHAETAPDVARTLDAFGRGRAVSGLIDLLRTARTAGLLPAIAPDQPQPPSPQPPGPGAPPPEPCAASTATPDAPPRATTGDAAAIFFSLLLHGDILLRMVMRVTDPPTSAQARARAAFAADTLIRLLRAA